MLPGAFTKLSCVYKRSVSRQRLILMPMSFTVFYTGHGGAHILCLVPAAGQNNQTQIELQINTSLKAGSPEMIRNLVGPGTQVLEWMIKSVTWIIVN